MEQIRLTAATLCILKWREEEDSSLLKLFDCLLLLVVIDCYVLLFNPLLQFYILFRYTNSVHFSSVAIIHPFFVRMFAGGTNFLFFLSFFRAGIRRRRRRRRRRRWVNR